MIFSSAGRPQAFFISRWIFLRLLGVVYLAAFLSLWVQVNGLIGSGGILPIADHLASVRQVIGAERYYLLPTLCWLDASDLGLKLQCAGGALLACLLIVGLAPALVLFLLWMLYLSLTVAGQVFLGYQWDALLLETGLLAIFLAPLGFLLRLDHESPPSRIVLWLFRWLLFRLMLGSGMSKLLSGDATWRGLTALQFHYETQPLPTWTSWYMHQLPAWFQCLSVLATFVVELLLPLLIFGPRRLRHLACAGIVGLQILIAVTGNYGFFNLLTAALCVLLLEDGFFPARWRRRLEGRAVEARHGTPHANPPPQGGREPETLEERSVAGKCWPSRVTASLAVVVLGSSLMVAVEQLRLVRHWPTPLAQLGDVVYSLRSINSYGLFAVMTTRRHEIIVEGSDDGIMWLPYEFKWKPGAPDRQPAFTGWHLPRLDWQMWFAALDNDRPHRWFANFLGRLRQGAPDVLSLLEHTPFPDRPPRYIRARLFDYRFSDFATRARTGDWWRREPTGTLLTLPVAASVE